MSIHNRKHNSFKLYQLNMSILFMVAIIQLCSCFSCLIRTTRWQTEFIFSLYFSSTAILLSFSVSIYLSRFWLLFALSYIIISFSSLVIVNCFFIHLNHHLNCSWGDWICFEHFMFGWLHFLKIENNFFKHMRLTHLCQSFPLGLDLNC